MKTETTLISLLDQDLSALDRVGLMRWCGEATGFLKSTYGKEGQTVWDDPRWFSARGRLLGSLISHLGDEEARRGSPLPCPRLYQRIGNELIWNQFDHIEGPDSIDTWRTHTDIDENEVRGGLSYLHRAFRLDMLDFTTLNSMERGYRLLDDGDRAEACNRAWTRFQTRDRDEDMIYSLNSISYGYSTTNSPEGIRTCTLESVSVFIGKKVLKQLNQAIKGDPDQPKLHYYQGAVFLQHMEKPRKALKSFENCLRVDPDFHLAWYGKGSAFEMMRQPEKARPCFERAGL